MLEFVLFFFGLPLVITLLYNYCERQKKRKARLKRIEQERIREAKIAQIAEHQRELKRQHEQLVHDQIELAKQQVREEMERKREDERLAKEQEKQGEQLAKHELEIRNLKNRMKVCEQDYKALKQRMENLNELYELASAELASADKAGDDKRKEKALRKIVTLDNQIASTEKRISKAKFDWNTAQKKLSA